MSSAKSIQLQLLMHASVAILQHSLTVSLTGRSDPSALALKEVLLDPFIPQETCRETVAPTTSIFHESKYNANPQSHALYFSITDLLSAIIMT